MSFSWTGSVAISIDVPQAVLQSYWPSGSLPLRQSRVTLAGQATDDPPEKLVVLTDTWAGPDVTPEVGGPTGQTTQLCSCCSCPQAPQSLSTKRSQLVSHLWSIFRVT